MQILTLYKNKNFCPKGHKFEKIGKSACDDILKCRCGKWISYCLGGPVVEIDSLKLK